MKIKVRKVKYKNILSGMPEIYEEIELNCQGTGIKEDPIIIDSSEDKSLNFDIVESDKYIIIKNCRFRFVSFYFSKNITVIDSKFRRLRLGKCDKIDIEKTRCSWLEMDVCNYCSVIETRVEESIRLVNSHYNEFRKCEFWNYFLDFRFLSRNNIFEDNEVYNPEEFVFKSIQDTDVDERNLIFANCYSNSKGLETRELICKGTGTKEDPYIIDGLDSIEYEIKSIEIFNRRDHLIIKNIDIMSLKLYDVKNVQLNDCSFSGTLILKFCSEIKIDQIYAKELKLGACEDIDISYSEFKKIDSFKGFTSRIKINNSSYKKIDKTILQ
ncbi:MAG: hypothetical protein ACFFA3_18520 [Promethearchaeota archaeon]